MKIALLQLNSTLGDFEANIEKALELVERQAQNTEPADLVVLPPFFISGSPLGGLASSQTFFESLFCAHEKLAAKTPIPIVSTSFVCVDEDDAEFEIVDQTIESRLVKFSKDGFEVLEAGEDPYYDIAEIMLNEASIKLVWGDIQDVDDDKLDCDVLINFVDETYEVMRADIVSGEAVDDAQHVACEKGIWILRSGILGAQDCSVYPGASWAITPTGELAAEIVLFDEAVLELDLEEGKGAIGQWEFSLEELDDRDFGFVVHMDKSGIEEEAADYNAIVLSVRDYLAKNGFTDCVVGISGGIDSAMVTTVAVDALGSEHVHGVLMPSMYSSEGSVTDATKLAELLEIETFTLPIIKPFEAFEEMLAPVCGGEVAGLTRENLQARIRTIYLMALSNQYGWVLLNTGNKSEAAAGFSTLYGDTAGAYAPFGNIYKTRLYELAKWRNEQSHVIPDEILTKAPSAELHPGQKDQDRLPEYEILDGICSLYLEFGYSPQEIVAEGYEANEVNEVLSLMKKGEYKRRCEPMGPWIDGISITDDRAWPVTNGFIDQI